MSKPAPKVTLERPSRPASQPDQAHLDKARKAVVSDSVDEKQLKVIISTKYHKGTTDIKNMSVDSVPVKYLVIEALDDLFRKYSEGNGHYKIEDQEELTRRLKSLL
ncbi:hypothetical protein QU926_27495 [Pseudomonas asiatica]|uniref:hypothetical protein n=1 Tax=Pseudomonas asiatica TaxID=2219225 RepID=UPI0025AABC5B|nr:hypothetical protein [Pseudomonas asiatica]MDM9557364.1 hypothetical protein [Pseudomonas asiatica]